MVTKSLILEPSKPKVCAGSPLFYFQNLILKIKSSFSANIPLYFHYGPVAQSGDLVERLENRAPPLQVLFDMIK